MFLTTKMKMICRSKEGYEDILPDSTIRVMSIEPFYDGYYEFSQYVLNCESNGKEFIVDCRRYGDQGKLFVWNHNFNSVYVNDYARLWDDVFKETIPDVMAMRVNS